MTYYRLYFLDPGTGRIMRFEAFEAENDAAALRRANEHADAVPLELWSGARMVRRLPANGRYSPPPDAIAV